MPFKRAIDDFYRSMMRTHGRVQPLLFAGMPGHIWSARLEIAGAVEMIDQFISTHAGKMDIEDYGRIQALRESFASHREAGHTIQQCLDALKAETEKWTERA